MTSPRLPAHRVTTAHMGAAYPFQAERGLSSRGVFIGRDVHSGNGFNYDPWCLYPDVISGHNLAVFGILGARKSSLVKTYCARQVIFGRQVWILDPTPEYRRLCEAVGGVYVSLRPGGSVRLNPLEALIRDRRPEAIHRARMDLMLPLTAATSRSVSWSRSRRFRSSLLACWYTTRVWLSESRPLASSIASLPASPTEARSESRCMTATFWTPHWRAIFQLSLRNLATPGTRSTFHASS